MIGRRLREFLALFDGSVFPSVSRRGFGGGFRSDLCRRLRIALLRWRIRNDALRYVYTNANGHYALTRDNQVVLLPDPLFRAYEQPLWPLLVEGHLQRVTYILAAHKDPGLAYLIPTRGPNDATCPVCGGSGRATDLPDEEREDLIRLGLTCWCVGLGWLPDGQGPFEYQ